MCYDELMVLNLLTQAYYSRVVCGSYQRFQHATVKFPAVYSTGEIIIEVSKLFVVELEELLLVERKLPGERLIRNTKSCKK